MVGDRWCGGSAVVVERCVGATFEGLLGCGTRGVVSVVKLSMNVLYFDVYLCYDHCVGSASGYFAR